MNTRRHSLAGAVILIIILLTPYHPVTAAPTGELKLAQATWGKDIPIPRFELSQSLDWLKLLYDPLFGTTPDGKLSPEHGLATKWEMTPDGLTWRVYLRRGVKFHDGVELTAKDVKFSIEQIMLPDSTVAFSRDVRETIRDIEIKDPYALVFHCKQPSLFFYNLFSDTTDVSGFILPKDYYEKVGKDQFMKKPIGTGPYKWHSHVVGSHIKLEATEKHWRDGVPRYKYVSYLIIPQESTRIAMLQTGEADITRISRQKIREVLDTGLKVISKKDHSSIVFHALMQWTSPAFSDIRFRKAVNLAIDRESVIKNIFGGRAIPIATFPGTPIFSCGGDPSLKPYPYDLQEARRLIKEGGHEGYEFQMPIFQRNGFPEFEQVAETLAGYWQKIGLKPKIFMTEFPTFRQRWLAHKVENMIYGIDSQNLPDCGNLVTRMQERYVSYDRRGIVHDSRIDAWFKKASSSLDLAEITRIIGESYRYTYDQYLMIPICMINDEIACTKRVPDWDPGSRRDDRNINDVIRQR